MTIDDSPTAYKLSRAITGVLSIKPLASDTSESELEKLGDPEVKQHEGRLYIALYTSEKSDFFCKFLKFNRT